MDYLLAKVRDRRNPYRILMSDQAVYVKPETLPNSVKYEPTNILDEEQWFFVDSFSQKDYCLKLLVDNSLNSVDFVEINKVDPERMDYLISYQNGVDFYFQRIFKYTVIRNKKFVHIGEDVEIKEEKNAIELNEVPDAVYSKTEDRLYFRKLETISPIFRGIDELYREATEEEVEKFLENEFISLQGGFSADQVKKSNRKRIAMAMDTLSKFNDDQKKKILEYTNKYFPDINFDGKSFEVSNEDDLRNLLYGIEQRLYTTPVTNEKRCASAVYTL